MNIADFLVKTLVEYGVTDVFGIPGGVVLDLLYALDRNDKISAHLCCHEQGAAFAAEGYAQVSGTLGAVYATRGPGFTNLVTAIADAYQESIPVLFITAHNRNDYSSKMRMEHAQELDSIAVSEKLTKYSVRIDKPENAAGEIQYACKTALAGRKGPVLIDMEASLWDKEAGSPPTDMTDGGRDKQSSLPAGEISEMINNSQRPVILAGSGIQLSNTAAAVKAFSEKHRIPILGSRCSQDLFADSDMYFGYIGSHGIRYSNFILSKTDLIISLGNRMAFPINSKSFGPIFEKAKTIRVDIDENEFERQIPNCKAYLSDLKAFTEVISNAPVKIFGQEWLCVCNTLKTALNGFDTEFPVDKISELMRNIPKNSVLVSDVGNNEFWVSRAYEFSGAENRILYSRSFGTLGNALAKSIGAYYKTRSPVICFIGDQGLQMNIQELQTISHNSLPILTVLLNNHSSGMIRSRQAGKYNSRFIHTTRESGYGAPDFEKLCLAYGIDYKPWNSNPTIEKPGMIELDIADNIDLQPSLPNGRPCQDMAPQIDDKLYNALRNC